MNQAKINQHFDDMLAACARQFAFNPRRIRAGIRYVGPEGHGKDMVYIFRTVNHSQLALKGTYVTLREHHGDKPHWTDAEKAWFKSKDAEIDAELAAKQAELEYTRASRLYQDHREQLLSHYSDWPGHQVGGSNPRSAAKTLIEELAAAHDERLATYAEHMGSNDPEHLAQLLLAPCHLDIDALKEIAGVAGIGKP